VGHTGEDYIRIVRHTDDIGSAVAADDINGVEDFLSIGAVKILAGIVHNQDVRAVDLDIQPPILLVI